MMNPMIIRSLVALTLLLSVVSAPALAVMPRSGATAAPRILVAGKVMIDAPESVDPGASVSVMISGSSTDGRIELWGPVTQLGKGGQIDSVVTAGGSASLMAPTEPGSYELRYINAANAVLARTALEIAAAPITLSAPRGLIAGIDTEIQWRGPAFPGDTIQIFDPASGAVLSETPAEGHPGAANVAILRGPENLGPYEVRYWSGTRQTVLRSLPVTVQAGDDWLRTPIEVVVGEAFPADWQGPTDAGNLYRIVDPETGEVVTSLTGSGTGSVELIAPKKPGAYRVQLVNPATGFVLADLPLDVDPK